jgi:hypothetical protein
LPALFATLTDDLAYRASWDGDNIAALEVVATEESKARNADDESNERPLELVRWICRWPWPLASRAYLYLRRARVDMQGEWAVGAARALDEAEVRALPEGAPDPSALLSGGHVLVERYESVTMYQRKHAGATEYTIWCVDDPKASLPGWLMNWVSSSALPTFMKKSVEAAGEYPDAERPK